MKLDNSIAAVVTGGASGLGEATANAKLIANSRNVSATRSRPIEAIPKTMAAYEMNGTPTLLVFDREGNLRLNHFGHIDDLALGAVLGELLAAP